MASPTSRRRPEPGAEDQRDVDGEDRRDGRDHDHARQHRLEGARERMRDRASVDRASARDRRRHGCRPVRAARRAAATRRADRRLEAVRSTFTSARWLSCQTNRSTSPRASEAESENASASSPATSPSGRPERSSTNAPLVFNGHSWPRTASRSNSCRTSTPGASVTVSVAAIIDPAPRAAGRARRSPRAGSRRRSRRR